jgi:hypothetical protein
MILVVYKADKRNIPVNPPRLSSPLYWPFPLLVAQFSEFGTRDWIHRGHASISSQFLAPVRRTPCHGKRPQAHDRALCPDMREFVIIQSGPLDARTIELITQRFYQVQSRTVIRAQADEIARVGWKFRPVTVGCAAWSSLE